jgi:hypothetical protein
MPDPNLQATALRYAAGDLSPDESAAFEARLAGEQDARDALAEAVRLSAQAIGQAPPAPHPSFRAILRARLALGAYRGSPLAWTGLGAAAVAACTLLGLFLAGAGPESAPGAVATAPAEVRAATPAEPREVAAAPEPADSGFHVAAEHPGDDSHHSVAEIWADLSDHQGVEKARDDEHRRRNHLHNLSHPHVSAAAKSTGIDVRNP